MIGEQILNYKLIALLGEGGMGSVYVGSHVQLGRKSAIKILHPNLVKNMMIRERFKNEASTLANLKHPNIVGLYDYLENEKGLFLIMEYVQGKPLDNYIQTVSGAINEPLVVHFFSQILDGFQYAHTQGVVHRDIKPSNLIITPENEVKILDFGIAKILDNNDSKSLTQDGTRMGTVLYMSPEQVTGVPVDNRSDIYSLGVTLFQAITGRCPYEEEGNTEFTIFSEIVHNPLPRANTFYPNVSPQMQVIIDKATAKNPNDRFQSCIEFKQALLGIVAENQLKSNVLQQFAQNFSQTTFTQNPNRLDKTPPEGTTFNPQNAPKKAVEEDSYYIKNQQGKERNDENFEENTDENNALKVAIFWQKANYWFSVMLFLGVIFGGMYVVLANPFEIGLFDKIAFLKSKKNHKNQAIKERIKSFYKAIETRNLDAIKEFYRENVDNYFNNLNRSFSPDITSAYQAYWKNYPQEKHEIDLNSWEMTQDDNKNYILNFKINYQVLVIKKKEKTEEWKSLSIQMEIHLDNDLKIFYIIQKKKG